MYVAETLPFNVLSQGDDSHPPPTSKKYEVLMAVLD